MAARHGGVRYAERSPPSQRSGNAVMPLEDFIITVFCWVEEHWDSVIGGQRLRQRGFAPKLTDSEVITMEVVGEFLGLDTDLPLWQYFHRHWPSWFPQWGSRPTFTPQAAHLWAIKPALHRRLVIDLGAVTDPIHLVDGCPLPLGVLTRARRYRLFSGPADYGYCAAKKPYYSGFHGHRMVTINGVITGGTVTPASADEREALWDLTEGIQGLVIGDKGYISAFLKQELATAHIDLQTPLRANRADPRTPSVIQQLTTTRRLVETVIAQLTGWFHWGKIWARDQWHLTSRITRKLLAHTLCIFVNRLLGRSDLQFEGLIA
ncbi:transposase [Candidatus Contendobacter odensis Run_B_J11]|uniref:Transposase n=2 Tax=Candidatus Contendibacter odensensis TaxID=1400860 RepID=A0A7U7G8U6_9GAMM|nr:transposase [Candidatus Contendobacter odensis Run_B_J11]